MCRRLASVQGEFHQLKLRPFRPAAPPRPSTWSRRAAAPPRRCKWRHPRVETSPRRPSTSWARWWEATPPCRPPSACCTTSDRKPTRFPTSSTPMRPWKGPVAWQVEVKTTFVTISVVVCTCVDVLVSWQLRRWHVTRCVAVSSKGGDLRWSVNYEHTQKHSAGAFVIILNLVM